MSKMTKAGLATVAMAASLTMLVAGCGAVNGSQVKTAAASAPNGGTLTIGQTTKWADEMVPAMDGSLYTSDVYSFMFDSILNFNNKLALTPWLVTKWKYSNGNKTITMWLDKNAKWSDGQPITSQDVLLDMNFLASKAYNTTLQGQYGYMVQSVVGESEIQSGKKTSFLQTGGFKIINSKEFQINLASADAAVLASDLSSITPLPYHVLGKIPFSQWLNMSYDKVPTVVSGAYMPANSKALDAAGTIAQLKANPLYWKGKPHISNIVIKYVSQSTEASLVESGQIGLALPGLTPTDFLALEKNKNVATKKIPELGYDYLGLPDGTAPWNNYKLRQAVMYGTDRQAMIQGVEKGLATSINTALPNISWAYTSKGMNTYPYSPTKAEQLIQSQGYTKDSSGYFTKNGQELGFTIDLGQGSATGQENALLIQQDMQKIGVKVTVHQPIDFNTLIGDLETDVSNHNSAKIQGWLAGWSLSTDPDPRGLWGSTDAYNFEQWNNANDDPLIKNTWALPQDFTQSGRAAEFAPWERLVNQQVPLIFLYEPDDTYVFTPKLHIPASDWTSAGYLPLNVQDWYLQ